MSRPPGLRALCILLNPMGESGGLSNKSLNIAEAVCSIAFWSVNSGTPLIRLLWRLPRLSKSSKWRCISMICERCISEDFSTCFMASACRAVACSTDPILDAMPSMPALRSVTAADRVAFISIATAWRSERQRACVGCVGCAAVMCLPSVMEPPSGIGG